MIDNKKISKFAISVIQDLQNHNFQAYLVGGCVRDALSGIGIPFYEVHISDIYKREEFRKFSYLSDIAEKVFCGLGIEGYELALMEAIGSSAKEK